MGNKNVKVDIDKKRAISSYYSALSQLFYEAKQGDIDPRKVLELSNQPSNKKIKKMVQCGCLDNSYYRYNNIKKAFDPAKTEEQFRNQFKLDNFKNFEKKVQNYPVIEKFANLRIMTYNIWFELHNQQNRFETIVQMILLSNANVICLQECTQGFIS